MDKEQLNQQNIFQDEYIKRLEKSVEIEHCLEKVRSRTMDMRYSHELSEIISVTIQQLRNLKISIDLCVLNLLHTGSDDWNVWVSNPDKSYVKEVHIPYFDHPMFIESIKAQKEDLDHVGIPLDKLQMNQWYKHLFNNSDFGELTPNNRKKELLNAVGGYMSIAISDYSFLLVGKLNTVPYTKFEKETFNKFSHEFDRAYRRFLDIQRAERQSKILKMYVDDNVLNYMLNLDATQSLNANESINATVMFVDICGFTTVSESESSETVINILNEYFEVMVTTIRHYRGLIDKFIGDGVMAVFKDKYHIENAINASIAIHDKFVKLKKTNAPDKFNLDISTGVNSGEMVSGNIGSISVQRLDYTVIGDAVNLASRLQDAAKPGQILISETLAMKAKSKFRCKKVGIIKVKNKRDPIVSWEVLG